MTAFVTRAREVFTKAWWILACAGALALGAIAVLLRNQRRIDATDRTFDVAADRMQIARMRADLKIEAARTKNAATRAAIDAAMKQPTDMDRLRALRAEHRKLRGGA